MRKTRQNPLSHTKWCIHSVIWWLTKKQQQKQKTKKLTDKVMYWQCYLVSEKNTYDKIRCHIPSGILRVLFGEWEKHLRQNPLSHTKWCTESAIWWVRKTRQNPLSHTKWCTDSAIRWLTKTLTDKVMYWWMRKTLTTNSVVTYEIPEWMDISTPGSLPRTATLVTQCNHCVK